MLRLKYRVSPLTKTKIKESLEKIPLTDGFANLYLRYRMLSNNRRMQPGFMIIGAQKCGTGTFYSNLVQHPQIYPAFTKEVLFFTRYYDRGLDWYRAQFPLKPNSPAITGEATPYYLVYPHVAERIAALYPDLKIIILLRDPVKRAYSEYQMRKRVGENVKGDFETLVRRQMTQINERPLDEVLTKVSKFTYILYGMYAYQIEAWQKYFPREQMLILHSDDYYQNPLDTLSQTATDFLGMSPWKPDNYYNELSFPYPKIDPVIQAELAEFYAPHNQHLYALIGRDFGWT